MSEKRLTYDILMNNYYQIIEKDDNGYCRRLSPTGIIGLLNEQQSKIKELEKKNKELKIKYTNRGIAITKAVEDLYRKEEVYLADFDICKRITEYEWEFNNE